MKKLISLISVVAIILSFSAVTFAEVKTLYDGSQATLVDNKKIDSVTYDTESMEFKVTATGINDQATLLAHPEGNLNTTAGSVNIEYIDQLGAENGENADVGKTVFKFKMKANTFAANAGYDIKIGGSNVGTVLSTMVVPNPVTTPTGYTVSGFVDSIAPILDSNDSEVFGDFEELEDAENFVSAAAENWKTTITLVPFEDLQSVVEYYFYGDVYEDDVIGYAEADPITGEFSIALEALPLGQEAVEYLAIFRQSGSMTYFKKVTFDNDNIPLGRIELLRGDHSDMYFSLNTPNLSIGFEDFTAILYNQASYLDYLDDAYYFAGDTNFDANIDFYDIEASFANYGSDYSESYESDGFDINDY